MRRPFLQSMLNSGKLDLRILARSRKRRWSKLTGEKAPGNQLRAVKTLAFQLAAEVNFREALRRLRALRTRPRLNAMPKHVYEQELHAIEDYAYQAICNQLQVKKGRANFDKLQTFLLRLLDHTS
jgi:phosphodiesterase/alkaline phosphatase D-like protein